MSPARSSVVATVGRPITQGSMCIVELDEQVEVASAVAGASHNRI